MAGPQFYNVPEVAEILRISKTSVHRMIHAEQLPAVKVGTRFRIPVHGVQSYLERNVFFPKDVA